MRLTPWTTAGLVFVAVALFALVALDASAPASCRKADDRVDRGLLAQAETAYAAILTDEPGSDCAERGMARTARVACERAAVQGFAGLDAEAEKAYAKLVGRELPVRQGCPRPRPCWYADTSLDEDLLDQADKAYRKILAAEPADGCALDGLRKVAKALCTRAKALDDADHHGEANKMYASLLTRQPAAPPCARLEQDDGGPATPPSRDGQASHTTVNQAMTVVLCLSRWRCRWTG